MNVFEIWFPKMGVNEGGFVDHPSDPGGATNRGVTLATFQSLAPSVLGIPGTLENLKKLTAAQQKEIARWYWNNLGNSGISTSQIKNLGIQYQAIEQFWGAGGANMFPLQHAANMFLQNKIAVDGRFGPQTLNALNSVTNQEELYHAVYTKRLDYHDAINSIHPKFNDFRNGWQRRLMESYLEGCKLMNYKPRAELYDRLIRWNTYGPAVLSFDRFGKRLNGQPFNDKGFAGNPGFNRNFPDRKYWLTPTQQVVDAVKTTVSEKKNT